MFQEIPVPITFNPHKHHFHFLKKEIENWRMMDWSLIEKDLMRIGTNLIDFYMGNLSVEQICTESLEYFINMNIRDKKTFTNWFNTTNFKKIQLSDQSDWLIKEGINPERYIHIHPAKYSKSTIRVRATTLKTVIALKIQSISIQKDIQTNLLMVNTVRQKMLHLSPVKSLTPGFGILKLWNLFEKSN